ncbi:MAG: hypothetical protein ACK47N_09900, partial [Microcystis sp.]
PEIAQRDFDYIGVNGFNPTLGHIAGLRNNPRIKATSGTEISEYSRLSRISQKKCDHQPQKLYRMRV